MKGMISLPFDRKRRSRRGGWWNRHWHHLFGILVLGSAFATIVGSYKEMMFERDHRNEIRADRIIREEHETAFRNCLREKAGAVGVANSMQENECRRNYLDAIK